MTGTARRAAARITRRAVGQTETPTPGVGPDELAEYGPSLVRAGWFLAGFLGFVLVTWLVVEPLLSRAVRRRNPNNPTLHEAISRYARLFFLLVSVFVGAGVAGYGQFLSDSALVVAAGTLAVGVAAQTVIGSLVSGLVLVADPEFGVGNYVEWGDHAGTIQSITLRVTRIQTPDGELVTVPNTELTSQAIVRPYGRDRYRVVERVGVDYEADLDAAIDHAAAAADGLEGVLDSPAPRAFVDDLGDDEVVVGVHFWLGNPRPEKVGEVRSAYARAVKSRLAEANIAISPAAQRHLEGQITVDERRSTASEDSDSFG